MTPCTPYLSPLLVLASTAPATELVARLHPLVVHFPIALLLTGACAEWWRVIRRRDRASGTGIACVTVGALGTIAAVLTGLTNASTQPHSAGMLEAINTHRLAGLVAAGCALVAMLLGQAARRGVGRLSGRWYVFMVSIAAVAVGITGHLGGSLVYGADYLTQPLRALGLPIPAVGTAPTPDKASNAEPSQQPVRKVEAAPPRRLAPAGTVLTINYKEQIRPIFEQHCFSCHGPTKKQGRLRLDVLAEAFTGESRYWAITPGNPEESEMIYRLKQGREADDRMPPRGSPLAAEQVALIATWIKEGAFEGVEAGPATGAASGIATPPLPATANPAAAPVSPASSTATKAPAAPALSASEVQAIESLRSRFGARVERLSAADVLLEVDLSLGSLAGGTDPRAACEALTLSAVLGEHVGRLVAAGLAIDDGCAPVLAQFSAASMINVRSTDISDASLAILQKNTALRTLVLHGTKITEKGIVELTKANSGITRIYAGATSVTAAALPERLREIVVTDEAPSSTPATTK